MTTYLSPVQAVSAAESVSGKYQFHSTEDVIAAFGEMGYELTNVVEAKTRKTERIGFQKHHLTFQKGIQPTVVGDSVLQIGYISSHDGTSAAKVLSQIYRKVCDNGLIAGVGEAEQWRVRHVGNDFSDRLTEAIQEAIDFEPIARNNIVDFSRRILSEQERRDFAAEFAEFRFSLLPDREIINPNIDGWLKARRYGDQGNSLWMTLNIMQEKAIRGGLQYLYRNETTEYERGSLRKITSIDTRKQVNEKIMEMAIARI